MKKGEFHLEVKSGGVEFSGDPVAEVSVDPENLIQEMADHPARMCWWGALLASLDREVAAASASLKGLEADEDLSLREAAAAAGRKVTEKHLEKALSVSPAVVEARECLMDINHQRARVKAVVDALFQRKDMMQSIARLLAATS